MEEDKVLDLKAALINKYKEFLDENRFEGGALEFDLDSFDLGEGVDKYYIDLQDIAIKPEHQGKGIGKEIVDEIKKLAEELGVPIVTNALDTEPTGFFAKQGFVFDKNMIGDFEGAMFYTPPNVTDDVIQLALSDFSSVEERVISLEDTLLEKYSDVLEFDESVLGDLDNKLPLQMNLDVDNSSILNLDVISVSQSKQNQGIGKSIMNDIIEFANANNLEIRVDSLSDEFFKKMGFENYANKDGIIDEAQFRKLPDTPIQNRSNVMDYSKWTTEELYEEFKKDIKNMDISRELDSRLPLAGGGTTFTENYNYEVDIFGYDKTSIKDWEDYAMNIPDDISQIKDEEMLDKLDFTSPLEDNFPDEDMLPNLDPETKDNIPEDLADGDMMNAQYDSEIEIPDTVPEDLVDEVDRERFREFQELQETEGDVLYDDTDRADTFKDNLIDADDTSTAESYADIASNEELPTYEDVVNQHNQQLDNVLDNIPIEKTVKKRIRNKFAQLSARLLTPAGWLDLLDFYETAVFGLGMIVAAAPELKGIASYYSTLAANHIGKAYGMNIPVEKLEPDWERINKVMDQVEAVTPTDILINKVKEVGVSPEKYISAYLPGFLPQSTINNNDVGTTLEKTLMNMPINKDKTETSSDKLKETLIYSSNNNEGNLMEKRETLEGKLIPFNKGVFNRLDEKDKISYNESRANRLRALDREKKEKDF